MSGDETVTTSCKLPKEKVAGKKLSINWIMKGEIERLSNVPNIYSFYN